MTYQGMSAQQVKADSEAKVKAWIADRNQLRDWHEYARGSKINRKALAAELDFSKSSCYDNDYIRDALEDAEALWFGNKETDTKAQEAALERAVKYSSRVEFKNGTLEARIAELEIENHKLLQELKPYQQQRALIENGALGFKS